jgi:hypothetical protein
MKWQDIQNGKKSSDGKWLIKNDFCVTGEYPDGTLLTCGTVCALFHFGNRRWELMCYGDVIEDCQKRVKTFLREFE